MFIFIIIITAHEQMTGNSGVLNGMTDSETCGFMSYSTRVISETFAQANLLAWYGKIKPNTTKACIHQSKQMLCNTK